MFHFKKIILSIFAILSINQCSAQYLFYACDEYGNLFEANLINCCIKNVGVFPVFSDLAITPDGSLYGIDTSLNHIDKTNLIIDEIIEIVDLYGNSIYGTGLVAVNDSLLIADSYDSLYLVNINTGVANNLGSTGYLCAGDMAFYKAYLYFSSTQNELIRIQLEQDSYEIVEVVNLGIMNLTFNVYGLLGVSEESDYVPSGLYGIEQNNLYLIDTDDISAKNICTPFENKIYGISEITLAQVQNSLLKINVITPNDDGINDCIIFNFNNQIISLSVLNRWGEIVYSENSNEIIWCGNDISGTRLNSGVYFAIINIGTCDEDRIIETYMVLTILN